jgi:hypothetical protein
MRIMAISEESRICKYVCSYIHIIYIHINTHVHTHIYIYIHNTYIRMYISTYVSTYIRTRVQACWQVLSPTRKETSYSKRRFWFSYILFIIIIWGILLLFTHITRPASKEIFSPSNKIQREVGRAKDLSAPRCLHTYVHTFIRELFGK